LLLTPQILEAQKYKIILHKPHLLFNNFRKFSRRYTGGGF